MPETTVYEVPLSRGSTGFRRGRNVDIVGVTGSIPVTPTIRIKDLARNYIVAGRFNRPLAACMGFALLFASPALAAPACVIVVANDRASTTEIFRHELAHCHGWAHPDQGHDGRPKKGYVSPKPPARFVKPYPGKLIDHWVTTDEAIRICGSYGCQWFE